MKQTETSRLSRRGFLGGVLGVGFTVIGSTLAGTSVFGSLLRRGPKFDERFELAIDLEINEVVEFRKPHRPYLAVWIEDPRGRSVRTLGLWIQTVKRGPRWIPDLRRWFAGEQARKQTEGGDLVATVSGATKNPGKYNLVWDGKDDRGVLVEQGEYVVFIEAAREHGTYQLMRQSVMVGKKQVKPVEMPGNIEIKGATVEFRKRK